MQATAVKKGTPTLTAPRRTATIQPKLMVNAPGDRYEQEADAMADQVMRMPQNQPTTPVRPAATGMIARSIQRKCATCEAGGKPCSSCAEEDKKKKLMRKAEGGGGGGFTASAGLVSQLSATRGGGSPLPTGTRSFMENAFSADFSGVRVHTDGRAAEMSRGIQAKAFTYGSDIYFNGGEFAPESDGGKRLLAHELGHVVQQGGGVESQLLQRYDWGGAEGIYDPGFDEPDPLLEQWQSEHPVKADTFLKNQNFITLDQDVINTRLQLDHGVILAIENVKSAKFLVLRNNNFIEIKGTEIIPDGLMEKYFDAKGKAALYETLYYELFNFQRLLGKNSKNANTHNVLFGAVTSNKDTIQILPNNTAINFSRSLREFKSVADVDWRMRTLGDGVKPVEYDKTNLENSIIIEGVEYNLPNLLNIIKTPLLEYYNVTSELKYRSENFWNYNDFKIFDYKNVGNLLLQYNSYSAEVKKPLNWLLIEEQNHKSTYARPHSFSEYWINVWNVSGFDDYSIVNNFNDSVESMNFILLQNLATNSDEYKYFNNLIDLVKAQKRLKDTGKDIIKIPAAFYPRPEYADISKKDKDSNNYEVVNEVPWTFYLYIEDFSWTLVDLNSPKEKKVNTYFDVNLFEENISFDNAASIVDPPLALFKKLNSALRFPKGYLYWKYPSGKSGSLETTEPRTLWQTLAYIGIALAALATVLVTFGLASPGVILAVGALSAAASIGSQVLEWRDKQEHGMLKDEDIEIGALFILADVLSVATPGLKLLAGAEKSGEMIAKGTLGTLRSISGKIYKPVRNLEYAIDAVAMAITVKELAKDGDFSRLAFTALLSGGFGHLSGKKTKIDVSSDGSIVIKTESGIIAKKAGIDDGAFLRTTQELPSEMLGNDALQKELKLVRESGDYQKTPIKGDSEFSGQFSMGNHTWKEHLNGTWCRFSHIGKCIDPKTGRTLKNPNSLVIVQTKEKRGEGVLSHYARTIHNILPKTERKGKTVQIVQATTKEGEIIFVAGINSSAGFTKEQRAKLKELGIIEAPHVVGQGTVTLKEGGAPHAEENIAAYLTSIEAKPDVWSKGPVGNKSPYICHSCRSVIKHAGGRIENE